MGRQRRDDRFRIRMVCVLVGATAWIAVVAAPPVRANHLFPLFPGDPLGDCGQTLATPPPETDATVTLSVAGFVDTETLSSTTVVEVGDSVTWQYLDDYCHTVTSTSGPRPFTTWGGHFGFEPELVRSNGPAETFTVTFDEPGTYTYVCLHHETLGVAGQIEVIAPGGGATT